MRKYKDILKKVFRKSPSVYKGKYLTLSKMNLSMILKIFLVFEMILIRILIKNGVLYKIYATTNFANKLINSTRQFRWMHNIRNIQWNLWIADTYGTGKECPLLGGVRYSEVNLEGFHRIGSQIVCPLFSMSAIQRFHCTPLFWGIHSL